MVFKFDIGYKGKTFHLETEAESLISKKIGDAVSGEEISKELEGAEFVITGASDKAGFPASAGIEGIGLNRALLTKGFAMKKVHKQKKTSNPKPKDGLRLRRSLRGETISEDIVQINLKLTKDGAKPLSTILGKDEKEGEKKGEKSAEELQAEMKEMMEKAKGGDKPAEVPKAEEKKEEKPVEEKKEEPAKEAEKSVEEEPAEKKEEKPVEKKEEKPTETPAA